MESGCGAALGLKTGLTLSFLFGAAFGFVGLDASHYAFTVRASFDLMLALFFEPVRLTGCFGGWSGGLGRCGRVGGLVGGYGFGFAFCF
jgi:hypothetical protein